MMWAVCIEMLSMLADWHVVVVCGPAAHVLHRPWHAATHMHPPHIAALQQLRSPVFSSHPAHQVVVQYGYSAGCQGRISPATLLVTLATLTAVMPCRFVYESEMPVGRLVRQIADKAQVCTQRSWTRPYGVGLLVAGHDKSGAKLFYSCPSGNFYEYKAMAIGSRSQASENVAIVWVTTCAGTASSQGQQKQLWALSLTPTLC